MRDAGEKYFERIGDPATRAQAGLDGWVADYPSDPGANSLSRRAGVLQASDPRTADALWARAERRMSGPPGVPLYNPVDSNAVSTGLRNDQYSPQYTFLPDQAWVR